MQKRAQLLLRSRLWKVRLEMSAVVRLPVAECCDALCNATCVVVAGRSHNSIRRTRTLQRYRGTRLICSATQQALPAHYRGITEEHLPAELFPGTSVVEHELPQSAQPIKAPLIVFLLDMCVSEEDTGAMKVASRRHACTESPLF